MSIAVGLQALGAGFQGGDAGAVVKRYRDQLESMERKQRVGSLLERMDISGPQRAILETMPAEQVPGMLWQLQQQQAAQRAAGGAAAARQQQEQQAYTQFMSQLGGGGQSASQPSPYSTGVPVNEMPMSNANLGFNMGAPAEAPQGPAGGLSFGQSDPRPAPESDPYQTAVARYQQLVNMNPPPPGTGARKAYDDALDLYERRMEAFKPPKAEKDPAAELRIARIMESGYSRDQAVSVVDGINDITPTGELMNRITGEIVGAPAPTGARVDPLSNRVDLSFGATVPNAGVNYPQAFGAVGAGAQIGNIIADAIGVPLPAPDIQRAQTAVSNLALQTVTTLQESFPGRPSVDLMKKLEEVAARPAQILRGDQRSKDIMEQTSAMIEDFIRQEQRKIENPRGYTMEQRAEARAKIDQLGPLLANYRRILDGLSGGGADLRPEVADRLKAYE